MAAKSKMGRPTEYHESYAHMLVDYLQNSAGKEPSEKMDQYGEPIDPGVKPYFPSVAEFAIKLGVHRDTLLEWSKDEKGKPEFSGTYKRFKDFQETYLIKNGLADNVSVAFAIFTAKNVIGWRDKQPGEDAVVNVNNYASKSDEELDARINELMEKNKK